MMVCYVSENLIISIFRVQEQPEQENNAKQTGSRVLLAAHFLIVCSFLYLLFYPEVGGYIFLRNLW
jgi:hypothetical protein